MKTKITTILLAILFGLPVLLYAQVLTQLVNNQLSQCQSQANQDQRSIAAIQSTINSYQADYAVQQNCINQYNSVLPDAQAEDATIQANAVNPVQNNVVVNQPV